MAGFPSLRQQLKKMDKDKDPALAKQVATAVSNTGLIARVRKAIDNVEDLEVLRRLQTQLQEALQVFGTPQRRELASALRDLQRKIGPLLATQARKPELCEV